MKGHVNLCGGLVWDPRYEIPNPDCPRSELHTPCPSGYIAWHEWANKMRGERRSQRRCPGCDLYTIVAPEPPDAQEHRDRLGATTNTTPEEG